MIRRILVPLDGSPLAHTAIPIAGAIAKAMDGEVRLIHVVDVPPAFAESGRDRAANRAGFRARAERDLADASRLPSLDGVRVTTSVEEGSLLDQLHQSAAAWPADLITMTTHGRGGLSRLWMGSFADRLVRSSAQPVMLVRPTGTLLHSGVFAPRRIVVPLDGSTRAEDAIPYAVSLAKGFGARILLLRGIDHVGGLEVAHLSLNPKHLEAARKEAEAYLSERATAVRPTGIETESVVLTEPRLAEVIADRTEDELIVMTTNGRGGLDRAVFGSVTDKVVRSANCPVLVIPSCGPEERNLRDLSREIALAADSVTSPAIAAEDSSSPKGGEMTQVRIDIGIDADKRERIAEGLSRVLADTYTLYLETHSFHWNVTGPMFQTLHVMFEGQYNELALAVDLVAERIRALGFPAPGTFKRFGALSAIEQVEDVPEAREMIRLLVHGHETVARTARETFAAAEGARDQPTCDLLTQRLQVHEKTVWMLRSLLE